MYVLSNDKDFPKEAILANGGFTSTYLGGLPVFDTMGINQKIQLELATSGLYASYPISQSLFNKKASTKIFIPYTEIEYVNVLHDSHVSVHRQPKSMAKRAMVGSMVGGRRGARLGALSAIGTKQQQVQHTNYNFEFQLKDSKLKFSTALELTNSSLGSNVKAFQQNLQNILKNRFVLNGDFSSLQTSQVSNNKQDVYDEISKLKQLFDQGIITEAEFSAKKKQLLNL